MRTARLGESWKRIFAFVLTFLLVLCAMPAALVNAAGEPLSPDPAAPYTDKSHVGGGPADSVEFPPYPGPGGVNIDKTAAWVDQDEGIAKVTLTINGQPKPEPVDVVLVLDVSGSMIQIEYNLCPECGGRIEWTTLGDISSTTGSGYKLYSRTASGHCTVCNHAINDTVLRRRIPNGASSDSGWTYDPLYDPNLYNRDAVLDYHMRDLKYFTSTFIGNRFGGVDPNDPPDNTSIKDYYLRYNKRRYNLVQDAATTFLNTLYGDGTLDHRVGLVSFSDNSGVSLFQIDYKDQASRAALDDAIAQFFPEGTTHYNDGLGKARTLISGRGAEYEGRPSYVVFMTDGQPNPESNDGATQSAQIKAGGTTIFTVGFGDNNRTSVGGDDENDTIAARLSSIATSPAHTFLQVMDDELVALFQQIAENVKVAGSNAVITDEIAAPWKLHQTAEYPMTNSRGEVQTSTNPSGVFVSPVDGSTSPFVTDVLSWNLGDITEAVATLTYYIKLDEGTVIPNYVYDTNVNAYVDYDNINDNEVRKYYPIPALPYPGGMYDYVLYWGDEADAWPLSSSGHRVPSGTAFYIDSTALKLESGSVLHEGSNLLPFNQSYTYSAPAVLRASDGTVYKRFAAHADDDYFGKPYTVTLDDSYGYHKVYVGYIKVPTGNLTVSKQVSGQGADENLAFEFTVAFTPALGGDPVDTSTIAVSIGGAAAIDFPADGKISLKHGESAVLTGIPDGVAYTVTETAVQGYTPSPAGGVATGTISKDNPATAAFVNTYAETLTGSLTVSKTVSGFCANEDLAFEFTIAFDSGDPLNPVDTTGIEVSINSGTKTAFPADGKISLKHDDTAVLTGIPDGASYTVTETPVANYTPSPVGGVATGTISSTVPAIEDFVNTYTGPVGRIMLSKKVTGEGADENLAFEFTVAFDSGDPLNPVDTSSITVSINAGAKTAFPADGKISLKHNDVAWIDGIPENVTYTVTETAVQDYTPTPAGGVATGTTSDAKPATAEFTNAYVASTGKLTVTKAVSGFCANENLAFEFTIAFDSGDPLNPVDTAGIEVSLNSGTKTAFPADGKISLKHDDTAVLTGIPDGVSYTVTETPVANYTSTPAGGVATGTISSTVPATADFVNTYTGPVGTMMLSKKVTGEGADENLAFEFIVAFDSGDPLNPVDTSSITVSINGEPKTAFPADGKISLKHNDTVWISGIPENVAYTVTETAVQDYTPTPAGGVATGTTSDTKPATIEFTNAYARTVPKGSLTISKSVTGQGADEDLAFEFTVALTSGNPPAAIDTAGVQVSINGAVAVAFPADGKISLKHGQSAVITGIPDGTSYTVTETAVANYTPSHAGGITGGTISSTVPSTAAYINDYAPPQNETKQLKIYKVAADGTTPLDGAIFTITGPSGVPVELAPTTGGEIEFTITADVDDFTGSYTVIETTAPAGKQAFTGSFTIHVDEDGNIVSVDGGASAFVVERDSVSITVKNEDIPVPPSIRLLKVNPSGGGLSGASFLLEWTGPTTFRALLPFQEAEEEQALQEPEDSDLPPVEEESGDGDEPAEPAQGDEGADEAENPADESDMDTKALTDGYKGLLARLSTQGQAEQADEQIIMPLNVNDFPKTLTTGAGGYADLMALLPSQYFEQGTYTLTETAAPNGYVLNTTPIVFSVGADGSIIIISGPARLGGADNLTIIVTNRPTPVIPPENTPTPTPTPTPSPTPSITPTPTPRPATSTPVPTPSSEPTNTPPPVTPPPTRTPDPDVKVEVVVDPDPPGDGDGLETLNLADGDIPLAYAKGEAWSLLNLMMSLTAFFITVLLLFTLINKKKEPEYSQGDLIWQADDEDPDGGKWVKPPFRRRLASMKVVTLLAGLIPGMLFLLLEDIFLPVTWITEWTPIIGAFFIIDMALFLVQLFTSKQVESTITLEGDEDDLAPPKDNDTERIASET